MADDGLDAYTLNDVIEKAKEVDHIALAAVANQRRRETYHLSRVVDIEEHDKQRRTKQLASVELHGAVHPRHQAKSISEWLGGLADEAEAGSLSGAGVYPSLKDRLNNKATSPRGENKPNQQLLAMSNVGGPSSGERSSRTSTSGKGLNKLLSSSGRQSMSGGEALKSTVTTSPLSQQAVLARLDRERFSFNGGADRRSSYSGSAVVALEDASRTPATAARPGSHVAPRERVSQNGSCKPEAEPTGSASLLAPAVPGQAPPAVSLLTTQAGIRQAMQWDRFSDANARQPRSSMSGAAPREGTPTNPFRRGRASEGGGPVKRPDGPDPVASSALGRVLAPTRACDLPPMRVSCAGRLEADPRGPVSPRGVAASSAGTSKLWPGLGSVRGETDKPSSYISSGRG